MPNKWMVKTKCYSHNSESEYVYNVKQTKVGRVFQHGYSEGYPQKMCLVEVENNLLLQAWDYRDIIPFEIDKGMEKEQNAE